MRTSVKGFLNTGLLMVIILFFSACQEKKTEQSTMQTVKIDTVMQGQQVQSVQYPGKIKPATEVNLAFRVAGPILRFPVQEGQFVKKGQLIAQIDPRDYKIQLAASQAKYDQVKAQADRVKELYKRNSVTPNDYDKAISGLKQITAKLHADRNALKDTRLVAPFDGYVQKKFYDNHETVDAGYPIVSFLNTSHFEVDADIPATDYIRQNQFAGFSCTVDVYPNQPIPLKLLEIVPKSNMNQLYQARFRLEPPKDLHVAAGMNANVTINYLAGNQNLMLVPVTAVFDRDGKSMIWVYSPQTHQVKAREVSPQTVRSDGTMEITSGLKAGELIVTAGVHSLKEGQKVKPMAPVSKTNIGGLL
jgi:RND family efflux transporter MFP subunit